jgi:hypothetical protein
MNRTGFRHSGGGSSETQQQDQTCVGNKRKYDGRIQGPKKRRAGELNISNSHTPVRIESAELPGFLNDVSCSRSNAVARMWAIGQFIAQLQRTPTMMVNLVSEKMITNPTNFGLQLSGIRF